MHIKIIAVGTIKDSYLREGINEYLKRLGPYAKVEIVEIREKKLSKNDSPERIKKVEAEEIMKYIKPDEFTVLLEEKGKEKDSKEFANFLEDKKRQGKLTFVFGGPLGLSPELKDSANEVLSLSPMTFTHQMARLILLEQIYRGFTIIQGKSYHY